MLRVSLKDVQTVWFHACVSRLHPSFFSSCAFYEKVVMIFVESCLRDLASPVSCFRTEDSRLGLAACSFLPFGAVGVAEVDDVG